MLMHSFLDLDTTVISGCPCAAVAHLGLGQVSFKNEENRNKLMGDTDLSHRKIEYYASDSLI